MNHTGKLIGTLMAALIMTIPVALCAEPIVYPLAGADSAGTSITHPWTGAADNHWDSDGLTLGWKTNVVSQALRGNLWGAI